MSTNTEMGDNFSLEPPLWLQQALNLNQNLNESPDESPQENNFHPSPAEEINPAPSIANQEVKNETNRKGPKRKKSKKAEKGPFPCDIDESACLEAPVGSSTVQKTSGDVIESLDVRFRLLRDNYCALRHHYGQLRKKYAQLETKHLKCVKTPNRKRKKEKEEEESEMAEKEFDTDDGLCLGGLAQLERESDEDESSEDEEERKSGAKNSAREERKRGKRKIRKVTFDVRKDETDVEEMRRKWGCRVFRVYRVA